MAKGKQRLWGVLFTDAGLNDLKEILKPYLSEGPIGLYLYCKHVDMDQPYYFRIVAETKNPDGSAFEAEIYVPHHYVKTVIAGADKKRIGFI